MESEGKSPLKGARHGRLGLAAFLAFAFGMQGCGFWAGNETCGTEIGDPQDVGVVAACVEDGNGEPVVAARVQVSQVAAALSKRAADDPSDPIVSFQDIVLHTDRMGGFKIAHLPFGRYRIYITDAGDTTGWWALASVEKDHPNHLFNVVRLKPKSSVSGVLSDGLGNKPIQGGTCSVQGTDISVETDEVGLFSFLLPEGEFVIRCRHFPHITQERKVQVVVGVPSRISMALREGESFQSPPDVSGLKVTLDQVLGTATVTWNKAISHEVVNYLVRRIDGVTGEVKNMTVLSPDTNYYDAVFGGLPDTVFSRDLRYLVACLRTDGGTGNYSGRTVSISRGPIIDSLSFLDGDTAYAVGDTARMEGVYSRRARTNASLAWVVKGAADSLKAADARPDSGKDTLSIPCAAAGDLEIRFKVKDDAGVTAWKSRILHIAPAP